jgi:hemoglobin
VDPQTVFDAVGGASGVLRLARAWHERATADEIVGHAFDQPIHPQHTERLAAYWGEAWGGPPTYSERYGTDLHDCFAWATTTTMAAYPADARDVPDGLSLRRWSWDGLLDRP